VARYLAWGLMCASSMHDVHYVTSSQDLLLEACATAADLALSSSVLWTPLFEFTNTIPLLTLLKLVLRDAFTHPPLLLKEQWSLKIVSWLIFCYLIIEHHCNHVNLHPTVVFPQLVVLFHPTDGNIFLATDETDLSNMTTILQPTLAGQITSELRHKINNPFRLFVINLELFGNASAATEMESPGHRVRKLSHWYLVFYSIAWGRKTCIS